MSWFLLYWGPLASWFSLSVCPTFSWLLFGTALSLISPRASIGRRVFNAEVKEWFYVNDGQLKGTVHPVKIQHPQDMRKWLWTAVDLNRLLFSNIPLMTPHTVPNPALYCDLSYITQQSCFVLVEFLGFLHKSIVTWSETRLYSVCLDFKNCLPVWYLIRHACVRDAAAGGYETPSNWRSPRYLFFLILLTFLRDTILFKITLLIKHVAFLHTIHYVPVSSKQVHDHNDLIFHQTERNM